MFPATLALERMVRRAQAGVAMIFAQWAMNASWLREENAAMRAPSGSRWCSKKTGRSLTWTSRRETPGGAAAGVFTVRKGRRRLDAGTDPVNRPDLGRRVN